MKSSYDIVMHLLHWKWSYWVLPRSIFYIELSRGKRIGLWSPRGFDAWSTIVSFLLLFIIALCSCLADCSSFFNLRQNDGCGESVLRSNPNAALNTLTTSIHSVGKVETRATPWSWLSLMKRALRLKKAHWIWLIKNISWISLMISYNYYGTKIRHEFDCVLPIETKNVLLTKTHFSPNHPTAIRPIDPTTRSAAQSMLGSRDNRRLDLLGCPEFTQSA